MHTIAWGKMTGAEPLRLEVYWTPGSRNVATPPEVSIVKGVFVWTSTDASVASGHSGDFDVYFIHDASASWILGSSKTSYWQSLGKSSTIFRIDPTQCICDLLAKLFPNQKPYHAWAGHSLKSATRDFVWHAVDWCWQAPDEYLSSKYHRFVLEDVSCPHKFYLSIAYRCKGTVYIMDPPSPTYPSFTVHV